MSVLLTLALATAAPQKDPNLAAALTVGAPLGVAAVTTVILVENHATMPLPLFWGLAAAGSLAFGAGHAYAGDFPRAGLVAAGAPVLGAGSLALGLWLTQQSTAPQALNVWPLVWVPLTAWVAYSGWAAWDAYGTAERLNLAPHQVRDLPVTGP